MGCFSHKIGQDMSAKNKVHALCGQIIATGLLKKKNNLGNCTNKKIPQSIKQILIRFLLSSDFG